MLDRLLGDWDITMHHSAMDAPVTGADHYERVLDGAFVLHRRTYDHPDFPDALALFRDEASHYFDVRGITRVFAITWDGDVWTAEGVNAGFAQRTVTTFTTDDEMESVGYASEDDGASWRHDFTMIARRRQ